MCMYIYYTIIEWNIYYIRVYYTVPFYAVRYDAIYSIPYYYYYYYYSCYCYYYYTILYYAILYYNTITILYCTIRYDTILIYCTTNNITEQGRVHRRTQLGLRISGALAPSIRHGWAAAAHKQAAWGEEVEPVKGSGV